MVLIHNRISINTSIGKSFDFFANPEKIPLWNYYVVKTRKISQGPAGIGTRYRQTRKDDEQILEIIAFEKDKVFELSTLPDSKLKFKRRITFGGTATLTIIDDHIEFDNGHPMLLQKLFRKRMENAVKKNLLKAKQLLERGKTALQDGRKMF